MRHAILGLIFLSTAAVAQTPLPADFSQQKFEERFRLADKDRNGLLTRAEAYAQFPRMPAYFDEIDANRDNQISLKEVDAALQRRIDAAISGTGSKYVKPADLASGSAAGDAGNPGGNAPAQFASKQEAARHHRYEYYEALAASQERARNQGEVQPGDPQASVLKKGF
jgi:hypothetical protein